MKILLILIILLSATLSTRTSAGDINICYQHNVAVDFFVSSSTDEAVLGNECFINYRDLPQSKAAELAIHPASTLTHDHYSPECWKGKKEDIIGGQ